MTFQSKFDQLRENAVHYYQAIVFPANRHEFDEANPAPRQNLVVEVNRINKKEREENLRFSR